MNLSVKKKIALGNERENKIFSKKGINSFYFYGKLDKTSSLYINKMTLNPGIF